MGIQIHGYFMAICNTQEYQCKVFMGISWQEITIMAHLIGIISLVIHGTVPW